MSRPVSWYQGWLERAKKGDPRSLFIPHDEAWLAYALALDGVDILTNFLKAIDSASTFLNEMKRPLRDYQEEERYFIEKDHGIFDWETIRQLKYELLKDCLDRVDAIIRAEYS
jgi:hypothetical protein